MPKKKYKGSMSVELWLSGFAIVISSLGLVLHFVRFRREKPSLQIETVSCMHYPLPAKVKQTQLRVEFYVHNRGDRATQLNSLELQTYQESHPLNIAIEAHRSVKGDCHYSLPMQVTDENPLCTFVVHYTHGEKEFCVVSKRSSKSLF